MVGEIQEGSLAISGGIMKGKKMDKTQTMLRTVLIESIQLLERRITTLAEEMEEATTTLDKYKRWLRVEDA